VSVCHAHASQFGVLLLLQRAYALQDGRRNIWWEAACCHPASAAERITHLLIPAKQLIIRQH